MPVRAVRANGGRVAGVRRTSPPRDLTATYGMCPDEVGRTGRDQLRAYRKTLPDERRQLVERFEIVDKARKVVGVGSVGTRAFIALLQARSGPPSLTWRSKQRSRSGGSGGRTKAGEGPREGPYMRQPAGPGRSSASWSTGGIGSSASRRSSSRRGWVHGVIANTTRLRNSDRQDVVDAAAARHP